MSRTAPPDEPAARARVSGDLGRVLLKAAAGSAEAVGWLVAFCLLGAAVLSQVVGVVGLTSWARGGLLTALLSLRADAVATVRGAPFLQRPDATVTFGWLFVPMLLTIGFLWFQGRAGRRAGEEGVGGPLWPTVIAAAAGAAVPAGILAALIAIPTSLGFPSLGLRIHADVGSAAAPAAALAAAGAAVGTFLRVERGRLAAAALRGGLVAYGWTLFLLALGVLLVSAFEPGATGAYVRSLQDLGTGGAILFGAHVLALPAQSALLLVPASGPCLHVLGEASRLDLCPWAISPEGPSAFLTRPLTLSPWLWILSTVPPVAAAIGGRWAAIGVRRGWILAGASSGVVFAALAVAGAWFASPWVGEAAPLLPAPIVRPDAATLALATLAWGILGGSVGAWLEARRYPEEPEPPRRTSV